MSSIVLTAKCPLQPYACAHHSCQCYSYIQYASTARAAAATATGVTAVAFAPAAAVAAVGVLAFFVWKPPDLFSQLSPQACRPDDVGNGRRAQLRVSKQHLKNRSKPKGSLPTLRATRHMRHVAATSMRNLTFGSDNRANPVAGCICRGNCRYCLCG